MFDFLQSRSDITAAPQAGPPGPGLRGFYAHFLAEHRRLLVLLFAVGFGVAVADAMVPVFIGRLVGQIAVADAASWRAGLPGLVAMALVIVVLRPALVLLELHLRNNLMVPTVTSRIRWLSHWHVVRQSWGFFQRDFAGRIAGQVMQTAGSLRESVEAAIRALWYLLVYGVTTVGVLASADARLALPTLAWFVGYLVFLRHFVPRLRQRAGDSAQSHADLMGRLVDTYGNILTVKLFAGTGAEDDQVRQALLAHDGAQRRHMRLVSGFSATLTLLNTALLACTAGVGVALWTSGEVDVAAIAMALPLVWQIANMASWISWEVTGIFENLATVEDGARTIAAPNEVVDAPGAPPLRVAQGEIRFEGVHFAYTAGRPVLDGLDLVIRPGERVGLVGRSGAGKSTLVNLLLRLFELSAGRILVDGQSIASVTQHSLRAAIAVVTQDTSLLHRSIAENLRYGAPHATTAQMEAAARQAKAHDFILGLRDEQGREGYAATVGERGAKLSGGQRQRIAIARVLLKNAPIVVLDEATSALDSEAERAIDEQLQAVMAGKTVLAIAHRLSTLTRMDRLIVLDEGRIVDQGTHAELIARPGLYADLWRAQSGDVLDDAAAHTAFHRRQRPSPDAVAEVD